MDSKLIHRKFYVNDKLEFSLFYNPNIKDKDTIIKSFLEDREWKWYISYFNFKIKEIIISEDLMEVRIIGKEV